MSLHLSASSNDQTLIIVTLHAPNQSREFTVKSHLTSPVFGTQTTAMWHSNRECPMNVFKSLNLMNIIIHRKSSSWQRFPEHDSNQHRHPAISDDIDLLLYCLLLPSSIVVFMKDSRSSFTFNWQQQCKRLKIIQTQISIRT